MIQIKNQNNQSGFALLMTIIVLSVVITVTLAIVDLSIKQLQLASDNTASETAFHAANAGLECARYTRNFKADVFERGGKVPFDCFGLATKNIAKNATLSVAAPTLNGDSAVYEYHATFDWGTTDKPACSELNIINMFATSTIVIGGPLNSTESLKKKIPGYENPTKTCVAGSQCTILSVTGYSSACTDTTQPGTLRREILLEF